MRLLSFAALMVLAVPATAAEIEVQSSLDAVTVYASGAEASRTIKQRIEAGSHTIIVRDLPAEAVLGSIRVEGQASGDLRIGAVDAKRVSVLSDEQQARDTERKELEDELEKLTDRMDRLRGEIETKETQKAFISNLTGLPQQPASRTGNDGDAPDWSKILDLIGSSMGEVQKDILATRIEMRGLGRRIEDIKKKLSELAPKQHKRTEVKVSVEADSALDAELTVKYQVTNASWRPQYDARLATGSAKQPASLTLTRRATIQQYTGEIWKDVALKLSTSKPSGQSTAPSLRTITVDFAKPPPAPLATYKGKRGFVNNRLRAAVPQAEQAAGSSRMTAPGQELRKARESGAQLSQTSFQASFAVPGRITVLNTGEAKRVKLDDQNIEPKLQIRTVPRRATSAYLYASLKLPKSAPYLAGRISLFRDGSFVGTGRLPNLAPGADHELGFGADASVTVKHTILGEKRGESGLISSSATDQRNYKISVTNRHARKIDVVIIDQVPVSLNEDIQVDLLGPTAPSKRNHEDNRGQLAWEFSLAPGASREISFGYTVAWPSDKKVDYGYR